MFKFTASAILAASAAATKLSESGHTEHVSVDVVTVGGSAEYIESINVLPDADVAFAMVQGTGKY